MAELVKVVVDAMGGDLAPVEPVRAAVDAVKERDDIQVILTGQEEVIYSELKKYQDYPTDRIEVVNATEVIETAEPPVFAIRAENGQRTKSRCVCFVRKYRSSSCRRAGAGGQKQRR